MNRSLSLSILMFSFSTMAHAHSFRHMVSFGTRGFGWSGALEQMSAESKSDYRRVDYFLMNLGINYANLITPRIQLGGFYHSSHQEHRFQKRGGGSSPVEIKSQSFGLFSLYNFSDDIMNAWYGGLSISLYDYKQENSHDFAESEAKAPFELDDSGAVYELVFGKRFTLKRWNIDHLTYAPQISIFYRTHGKDFDDQKILNGVGTNIQPIKFDLLF